METFIIPIEKIHELVILYLDKHLNICDLTPGELIDKYIAVYEDFIYAREDIINREFAKRLYRNKSFK